MSHRVGFLASPARLHPPGPPPRKQGGGNGKENTLIVALLELPRHALHARRIAFTQPTTGERVEVIAPWPEELEAFWQSLAS